MNELKMKVHNYISLLKIRLNEESKYYNIDPFYSENIEYNWTELLYPDDLHD